MADEEKEKIRNSDINVGAGYPAIFGTNPTRPGGVFIGWHDGYHARFHYQAEEGKDKNLVTIDLSCSTFSKVEDALYWLQTVGVAVSGDKKKIIKECSI